MDLVTDDEDVVLQADVTHCPQLVCAPHTAHGVMGAAEDQHPGRWQGCLRCKVVEVELIAYAVDEPEGILHHGPVVLLDGQPERIVDRRLDDDAVAR
ncbi:MAG: hypothetical protein LKE50_06930 [Atopobiaceae bacterium]|nr:hypothetical protein [Atopobiaceae bacterium]